MDKDVALNAIARMLGRLHKILGESDLGTYVVVKVRNQCDAVVRARFSDGPIAERNGELLLIRTVAPHARYFVDVGANVGAWAKSFLEAMALSGSGLLFEPSPETASRARVALRNYAPRIEVVEAAVGEESGKIRFFAEPQCGETSSVVSGFSHQSAVALNVRMTTLDREFEARAVEYVDVLKVDVEGFDLKVLKGAKHALKEGRIGIVQFEYNAPWAMAGSTLAEAISLLESCGYTVFLLKADGLHGLNYRPYGEYFGYSNYVAVSGKCNAMVAALIRDLM